MCVNEIGRSVNPYLQFPKHEGSFDSKPFSPMRDNGLTTQRGRFWTADYGTGIKVDRRNKWDQEALRRVHAILTDIYDTGRLARNKLTLMVPEEYRTLAFELMKQEAGEPRKIIGAK